MANPEYTPSWDGATLGSGGTTSLFVGAPAAGCFCLRNHISSAVPLIYKFGSVPSEAVAPAAGVGYLEPGESMNFGNINLTTFVGIKAGAGAVVVSGVIVPAPDGGGGGSQ